MEQKKEHSCFTIELSIEEINTIEGLLENIAHHAGKVALQYLAIEYFVPESFNNYGIHMEETTWQDKLTPIQFSTLRKKGTERAFSSVLNTEKRKGLYCCAATQEPLFSYADKFNSGSGWPSFTKPVEADVLRYTVDNKYRMLRIEVLDALSGSHLGHVFPDGSTPTGLRYCINGAALLFIPKI